MTTAKAITSLTTARSNQLAAATRWNASQRDYLAYLIVGTKYETVADFLAEAGCPDPSRDDAAHLIDMARRHWGYTR